MINKAIREDRLETILLEVINNPEEPFMLYYSDRGSMNRTRVKLLQRKNKLMAQTSGAVEFVRINSEALETATPAGYTHRITVSYDESTVPEMIVRVSKDGEIIPFQTDNTLERDVESARIREKITKRVEQIVDVHDCETVEDVLAHTDDWKHKPSKQIVEGVLNKRQAQLKELEQWAGGKEGMLERNLQMMKQDGFTREKAKEALRDVPDHLLDKYFPEGQ
jgi:hypothetical protein